MPGSSERLWSPDNSESEDESAAGMMREATARLFRALGHPMRLRIIELLGNGDRSVSELAVITGCSAGAVSKHLQALASVHIVSRSQEGNFARYSLRESAFYRLVGLAFRTVTREIERLHAVAELVMMSGGDDGPSHGEEAVQRTSEHG